MNANTRAVIVVFDEDTGDVDAAMVRNGLRMFRGVQEVIPVRGVPSDNQARNILAKDKMAKLLQQAEQKRDELASRLANGQAALTGPVPSPDPEPEFTTWRRTS